MAAATSFAPGRPIAFDEGWSHVRQHGVEAALSRLESLPKSARGRILTPEETSQLYTITYQMCTQATPFNWSGKLYYAILDELQDICERIVEPKLAKASDANLLHKLIDEWSKHTALTKAIGGFLRYIDRFYVSRLALLTLKAASVKAFHDFVFSPNKSRLTAAFVKQVRSDRISPGSEDQHQTLRSAKDIFIAVGGEDSLHVYEEDLVQPLLQATEVYMKELAEQWIKNSTCSQYLYKVRAQLNAEDARVDSYLHPDTRVALLRVCERQLISEHLNTVLNMPKSGCKWLLQNDKEEDLKLMFLQFRRVPNGLAPMGVVFRKFLQEKGADLFAKPRYENQWENRLDDTLITDMVALHHKYRALIRANFAEHNTFHRALKEAFEFFVNLPLPPVTASTKPTESQGGRKRARQEEISVSELLSDHIDRRLRKAPAEMVPISPVLPENGSAESFLTPRRETELERKLVSIVDLFGYVNDKDVFGQFYLKHLAKRLILGRSNSVDAEQIVIGKLKQVCGNPFVSKFTGMIKDLMLARSLQNAFVQFVHAEKLSAAAAAADDDDDVRETKCTAGVESHLDPRQPFGFDVNVKVLTAGFWPSYKNEPLKHIPAKLQGVTDVFARFYATRTAHRVVTWIHALGTVVLKASFPNDKKVDITVTTFQAAILLLFNLPVSASADSVGVKLTEAEIADKIGTDVNVVRKHLYALVKGKYKLLMEEAGEGNGQARYAANWNFETRARRIKVPLLPADKSAQASEDRLANLLKISEERRYAVEATIVRIMKAQRQLRYAELSSQVVSALAPIFQAQAKTIRKRVDDLVERDYLELDEADDSLIKYVA